MSVAWIIVLIVLASLVSIFTGFSLLLGSPHRRLALSLVWVPGAVLIVLIVALVLLQAGTR